MDIKQAKRLRRKRRLILGQEKYVQRAVETFRKKRSSIIPLFGRSSSATSLFTKIKNILNIFSWQKIKSKI